MFSIFFFPVASKWAAHLWKPYRGGRWGVWRGSRRRPLLLQCKTACRGPVPPQTWESVQVRGRQPRVNGTRLALLFHMLVWLVCWLLAISCTSPSQGLCCSQDCGFKPAGQLCDAETDCQRASVCSGLSPHCPEPSAKENLTVCSLGTRVCLNGVSIHRPSPCILKGALQFPGPTFIYYKTTKAKFTVTKLPPSYQRTSWSSVFHDLPPVSDYWHYYWDV